MINIGDLNKATQEYFDIEKSKRLMNSIDGISRTREIYNNTSDKRFLELINLKGGHVSKLIELSNIKVSIELTLMFFGIIESKI